VDLIVLTLIVLGFVRLLVDDGMSEENAKEIGKLVTHYLISNRPSYIKNFM